MCEPGWRLLSVPGPLDFELVGVLAGLTAPLAAAGVIVLAVATHDTDHLLVPDRQLPAALRALGAQGWSCRTRT